jgi:alkylhydroperoxidase family enzyme
LGNSAIAPVRKLVHPRAQQLPLYSRPLPKKVGVTSIQEGNAMLRRLILARIAAAEKDLGVPLEYCRYIVRVSLRASLKFAKFLAVDEYHRVLPPGPCYVARIVAVRDADCGTCVQIAVNQAKKAGLTDEVLRAVLCGKPGDLPEELSDAYRFAEAVVTANGEEDSLRERIRLRYGDEGLIEMALAIASCRVFPITKRALGYAVSCSALPVRV